MAFVGLYGIWRVEMLFVMATQKVENVFHVNRGAAGTSANMSAMAGMFKDWWVANLKPITHVGLVLGAIKVTDLSTVSAPAIEYGAGLPVYGDLVSVQLPMNVTVAVRWSTALRGRSFRGRTYHLGFTQAQVTASTVDAGPLAQLVTAYSNLINLVQTQTATLGVYSTRTNNAQRANGVFTNITGVTIENVIDSQRRRLPGRGA